MKKSTDAMKMWIDSAKNGNESAFNLLRTMLATTANDAEVPNHVIISLSECLLHLGIEANRVQLEAN